MGLQSAAALLSSCDRVVCIGVDEETLMVCNVAGLQIRRVIEIEPDAFGLTTRYNSSYSLVGPIDKICSDLALSVETKLTIRNRKSKVGEILDSFTKDYDSEEEEILAMGGDPFFLDRGDDLSMGEADSSDGSSNMEVDVEEGWDGVVDEEAHFDFE